MRLDRTDKKLLFYLSQNGRLSISSLSANIGLSRESVKARIEKMVKNKVILSFTSVFSHPYFGLKFYNLYLSFSRLDAVKDKAFENYIKNHSSVMWANKCLGKWDFALTLLIKDSLDFSNLLADFKERFKGFIKDFEFEEVLYEMIFRAQLPAFFEGVKINPFVLKKEDSSFFNLFEQQLVPIKKHYPKIQLTKTDVKILDLLSINCRIPLQEMSVKLNLPTENIRYRMKRMIEKEALTAFWTGINYDLFGLHWYRIRFMLNKVSIKEENNLKQFLINHPNVFWATRSVGKIDLHIDIRAKDNNQLNEILADFNSKFGNLIIDYETIIMTQKQEFVNFTKKIYDVAK